MPSSSNPGATHRPARRPTGGGSSTSPVPGGGTGSRPVPGPGPGRMPAPMPSPDEKKQKQARKMLMDNRQLSVLQNDLRIVGLYVNSRHLEMLAPAAGDSLYSSTVEEIAPVQKSRSGIAVYRVTKLMYNEEENSFEKLVSVYSALNSFGGIVAMILQSDGSSTHLYLATNISGSGQTAGELLASNMRGQFPGCEISRLSETEKNTLLDSCGVTPSMPAGRTVRSLSMIPSRREDERQHDREYSAQGYEKFVDAMNGHRYTLVVLSQMVSPDAMEECLQGLETMYTSLSPYAKETVTYGENESDTINYSVSSNINSSVSHAISHSFGSSHTSSISHGRNSNSGRAYELFGMHFNSGRGTSEGTGTADGTSTGESRSDTSSDSWGSGDSQSSGSTTGVSRSLTMNRDNKAVQNLLAKIEEHMKRIGTSQTFGMWNSACYVIADDVATANMGTSTLAALFSGDSTAAPRAYYNQWDAANPKERGKVLEYLQNLRHPVVELTMYQELTDAAGKKTRSAYQTEKITPAMMISGKEIPTLMGLPRKSVPGVVADSMAEFGRNIPELWKRDVKRPILFGNVYHMGQEEKTPTFLNLDTFASHVFICGSSGSGKSNTTYNLLQKLIDNRVPFLVIEPAKGEYKTEFGGLPGINIFTAEESPYRLLRINPFEFRGIHIREHLDNIIQVVSACWPLYGAMPGLLKQAFEQAYLDHGWDLEHSERIVQKGSKFPVFQDLAKALERIIENSPYSAQTKGDYKGALLNRVSSLCNGFEGQIFGRSIGIPDRTLFGENTIIDLSSIGSDETRSLIMGILIIRLKSYRKAMASAPNSRLVHVTVLEEAHNILKRCSQDTNVESGNVQGAAVGGLCRCIAEMRSAGEGFMIIDQSPGAVDEAAIRNTAIKIVMRLPSKNDCEEMGAALSLNENQIRELSRLDIGIAAIFHAGWTDTLLARMGSIWDKRYRLKTLPVLDSGTCTRIQGAVVQLMYRNLVQQELDSVVSDVQELLELLCTGPGAVRPVLPVSKQKEILEEVQVFAENNELPIRKKNTKELQPALFDFVFSFLRLDSVMRIFPLSGVNTGLSLNPLTKEEIAAVLQWESELRGGVTRYLYMPEECEPAKNYRWPLAAENAEYFYPVYSGLLSSFERHYSKDFRYKNALLYLDSIHFFSRKTGRK